VTTKQRKKKYGKMATKKKIPARTSGCYGLGGGPGGGTRKKALRKKIKHKPVWGLIGGRIYAVGVGDFSKRKRKKVPKKTNKKRKPAARDSKEEGTKSLGSGFKRRRAGRERVRKKG